MAVVFKNKNDVTIRGLTKFDDMFILLEAIHTGILWTDKNGKTVSQTACYVLVHQILSLA